MIQNESNESLPHFARPAHDVNMKSETSTQAGSPQADSSSEITSSLAHARKLERRIARLEAHSTKIATRLSANQTARITTGTLFFVGLVIGAVKPVWRLEVPLIAVFLIVFSTLMVQTGRLRRHLVLLRALQSFYERQRRRCLGEPCGRSPRQPDAALPLVARDLGLTGPHSLLSLIDETLTDRGYRRLLEWISTPPTTSTSVEASINTILQRQKTVQSLRRESWFYTRLTLLMDAATSSGSGSSPGSGDTEFRLSSSQVLEFLQRPFVETSFQTLLRLNWLAWIAFVMTVVIWAVTGRGTPGPVMLVYAAFNFWCLNRVGPKFLKGVGLSYHLSRLKPIFARIEVRARERPETLGRLFTTTVRHGPSREARRLGVTLSFLGIEANPLLYLLINAASPWTITGTYFLERRRRIMAETFPACLDELNEFEALGSLLLLDRHQTRTYPEFSDAPALRLQRMFHPLLARAKTVANDFEFRDGKTLGLLTGSNMSGKSTFLRTVGLNQILANIGAPVFAASFTTHPFRVETCIEVSDSLRDGFSYFYAEVRRLKALLDQADSGEPILFLVDEIFRGTNNHERQIGSRAVIRSLARRQASRGFISTHDLELTTLETTELTLINLHFREDMQEGRMIFTYRLHSGPCPTTNALKIMQLEGIQIE